MNKGISGGGRISFKHLNIMKKLFLSFLISSILLVGNFLSCKKETSCEGCKEINKPPIAIAGPDQVITLPTDSVSLDGNSSSDPDGKISEWLWTKISGPAFFNIIKPSDSTTKVRTLVVGTYQFELKVTDYGGLSAKDTVKVIVNDPSILNRPPVANAGADQTITLPTNSVTVNGSGSTDPDNNITNYVWTKISGPSSFNIGNANATQTLITNLEQGVYHFELKVTDAGLLISKDTMKLTVNTGGVIIACDGSIRPQINAQLVPLSNLSITREGITVASANNKILFAGGYTGSNTSGWQMYSRVDIFDVSLNQWTTTELSQPRWDMATAVLGNKIFFAGGVASTGTYSTRIDVYDALTNGWSTMELGSARTEMVGAAAGNKVVFVGGVEGFFGWSNKADVYDVTNNTWSVTSLTDQAVGTTATVIGNKIYFAGNASDWWAWDFGTITSTISIYDVVANTWSTSDLSIDRGYLAGIAVGNKNYWAGGLHHQPQNPFTNLVEIRDENTGISTFDCLFQPNAFFSAVLKNNKIVFFTSGVNIPVYWSSTPPVMNKFDIYDITTNTWSVGVLPVNIYASSIISVNNTIYVAGGIVNGALSGQVWKLEF